MTTPTFLPFVRTCTYSHAEPHLLNPLRASPAAYEKAWLSARLLGSMDTHLPERAFSLTHGTFILGVPSSRKRNFGGTPCLPCISAPVFLYRHNINYPFPRPCSDSSRGDCGLLNTHHHPSLLDKCWVTGGQL